MTPDCQLHFCNRYSSRYNLIVDQVCSVCSDDNIIEPGESLVIDRMKVLNNGGMHTPIAQNVGLYLESNQWISFNRMNTVYFDKSLKVYEVFEITKLNPLRFKINDYTQPAIDTTFKSTAVVDYRAVVERVNKEFKTVADKKDNYTVMFPVEISPVQALRSIQQCEESPFVVSIWNRSSKSIGINHNRLLNFRLTQLDNVQKVVFLPKFNDNQDKNNRNSSEWGQKARDQSNFINPKMSENSNCIIEQEFITTLGPNFHIQLTEGYSYDPKSEFLLIFNCETSKTLIDSFKQFAETLGSSVDLWNISNYQGFTFDFISHVGLPFYNLYQNKVVIILSNEFQLINSKRTNAVKQIKEAHIYKGIKDYNMQMHILGPSSNYNQFWLLHPNCDQDNSIGVGNQENQLYNKFTTNLTDKKDFIQIDHDIQAENISPASYINNISFQYNFHTNISCCSNPSNKIIFTESKSILKKIDQLNPQCSHILTYTYNPILLLEGIFSKKYILGQITVIESLRKDCASLIIHSKTYLEQDLNIYDQYNLIKLLSFEKKLYYLKNTMGNVSHAQLIIQAIVSDLCDEYATYQKQSQNTQQLQVTLKMWKYFMEFNIQELFQTHIQPQLLPSCIFSDKQLANLQGQNNEENILIGNQQNNGQQYQHDNPILENKNEINLNEKKRETEINKEKQQQYDNHLYISSISSQGKQQIETSSKIKYYFIDYLISFKAALKKQVSLLQKCCFQATAKVNSHCQTILDVVLLKKMQTSQNIIDQYGEQQTKKYEVIKKQNVFQMYQQPNKLINTNDFVQQNNLGLQSMIYNTRDFPSFNYQLDQSVYIQNDSFMFNDPNSQDTNQDKRLNKINIFENQIYFDQ
ncbi:hypothetical protein ABPG72_022534 [Tetrahymena utriculariae]